MGKEFAPGRFRGDSIGHGAQQLRGVCRGLVALFGVWPLGKVVVVVVGFFRNLSWHFGVGWG